MKLKCIAWLLLPLFVLSCSKMARQEDVKPSAAVPFKIAAVQTPEATEQSELHNRADELLQHADYDKLETLSADLRASKQGYADGMWKLMFFYDGVAEVESQDEAVWQARQKLIQNWIDAKPQSVTARVTMARFLKDYAWHARGSGYANTVSDKGWQLLSDRLNQAGAVLKESRRLKDSCPLQWSTLLVVALGLQVDKAKYNDIFNQAIQAEPDYKGYYQVRATFLLPRWYGTEGEWVRDLSQSAYRIGGADGDMVYAQVVWSVHHYGTSENVFKENPLISWERVDRGFEVILKRFPDSLAAKNERAHLASLAGDQAKARDYFKQTEGKVDLSVWYDVAEYTSDANWAFEK